MKMQRQTAAADELESQSSESARKDAVIAASRLVYSASNHEQVQRHIRRMGDKIMALDSALVGRD